MNFQLYKLSNCRGIAIFIAVLTASVALTIGAGVMNIVLKQIKLASLGKESIAAFSAADTGFECALYWDNPNIAGRGIFGVYGGGTSPPTGYTAHWALDEGFGATTKDAVSNTSGDLMPAITPPGWISGKVGSFALNFDGSEDYIDTKKDLSTLVFPNVGTVAVWIKPTGSVASISDPLYPFNNASHAIGSGEVGNNIGIARADYMGQDRIWVYNWNSSNSADYIGVPYVNDNWAHIVWVHSGSVLSAYKDGVLIGSVPTTDTGFTSNYNLFIGTGWSGGNPATRFWRGDIDEVYTYNRALTSAEVGQLYNATAAGFTDPNPATNQLKSCADKDITSNWSVDTAPISGADAESVFKLGDTVAGPCATVTVTKASGDTTITSRGYDICGASGKRVERGIQITY